jgi:hypothetical protein
LWQSLRVLRVEYRRHLAPACTPSRSYRGRRTSAPCAGCPRTSSVRTCRRADQSRSARTHAALGASHTLLPAAHRRFSRSKGRCSAVPLH